ncbi:MAG: hypothetical protein U0V75_16145 [Ferruginibacter sp.]
MMVKRISFFVLLFLSVCTATAQVTALDEKKPETVNGIEFGYYIRNEQEKTVKDEEYSRFEITFYAVNKSGCSKIFLDRGSILTSSDAAASTIASFSCINANGKRFTSKGGSVKAKEFYVNVKVRENDKDVTRSAKAGFIFRNGETISSNIIVLVPKGERPKVQCMVNNLAEL